MDYIKESLRRLFFFTGSLSRPSCHDGLAIALHKLVKNFT
jgi:hypothetical protein